MSTRAKPLSLQSRFSQVAKQGVSEDKENN